MIKYSVLLLVTLFLSVTLSAQDIQLPKPQTTGGMPLRDAMSARKSTREFSATKPLSTQQLSDLLWMAFGVNREDGRRTAPSAMNAQEIDVYVFNTQGVYLYQAKDHELQLVKAGDYRSHATRQPNVQDCPLILVFVADLNKFARLNEPERLSFSATDAGYVSQNVYLFCAQEGLNTVALASVDHEKVLALIERPSCRAILAQPVGYPK